MKIMVVDDEPLINKYIVQSIRDTDADSEVIGLTSGIKAMEWLEKQPVDLAFVDITMPKMDGIKLLEAIKNMHPSVDVVMLTCHEDFEYAREAMQKRASGYILKTEFNTELIQNVLESTRNNKRERSTEEINRHIIRNNFLKKIVEKNTDIMPLKEAVLRENCIDLSTGAYMVAVFGGSEKDASRIREDIGKKLDAPIFYEYSEQEMFVFGNTHRSANNMQRSKIRTSIAAEYLAGFSHIHYKIEELSLAFEEAVLDRDSRFYLTDTGRIKQRTFDDEKVENHIMRSTLFINDGEYNKSRSEITELMKYSLDNYVPASFLKKNMIRVFAAIQNKLKIELQPVITNIGQSMTISEMQAVIDQGFKDADICGRVYSSSIQKAIEYVNEHYTEDDVSLNKVADSIYLNRDYLSRQFKKEVGSNFSEYLLKLRMDHAKSLLKTTNMKVADIALSVGIGNMSYFSTAFQKVFKCKPKDIRKND